jgi:hypothetical protein
MVTTVVIFKRRPQTGNFEILTFNIQEPTFQLSWCHIEFLIPSLLTIIWKKLHFEKLTSQKESTCCNMMRLELQAK